VSSEKTLCIATGIFPPDTGGPANFARSYAVWARKHDKKLSFISLTDGPDSCNTFHGFPTKLVSRNHSFFKRFIKTSFELARVGRSNELILANGLFLEILIASYLNPRLSYFTKVPGDIVWERARNVGYTNLTIDAFQDTNLNWKWRLFRKVFTSSLKRSRLVIVPSKHLFDLCAKWGVKRENIRLIYNSVNTNHFMPKRGPTRWDVITVCRLVPWKGVDEIVEVCARLDLKLCVVGDGPQKSELELMASRLGCDAEFVGNQNQIEVKQLLDKSRIFVLNSSFEATAYALIEARASGLPSIARRNTGSEEVIDHGVNGFLCDEKLTLLEALEEMSNNPALLEQFSASGVEDAKHRFDFETNFKHIYELVVGRK
jgi:glycosyltransferase involved in cell wall biosynthesis